VVVLVVALPSVLVLVLGPERNKSRVEGLPKTKQKSTESLF
jgi:hypothetical protein